MLRSISTNIPVNLNISVILNFGCNANCWYCVWKGHELENVCPETDWDKLGEFLIKYKDKGKVSVSGGGDCLYNWERHASWWTKFFQITRSLDMLVDVHTREKFVLKSFWKEHINRCVFSSDILEHDKDHLEFLSKLTKIRITHVVTANTTKKIIKDFLTFQDKIDCQFTIKELVGFDDNGMYEKIKEEFSSRIYSLNAGDYNIYYMPDNTIRGSFL